MCAKASLIRSTLLTNTKSALRAEDYSEIASQIVRISFTVPFWNWLFRLPLVNNRRLTARSEAITVCCLRALDVFVLHSEIMCFCIYFAYNSPKSTRRPTEPTVTQRTLSISSRGNATYSQWTPLKHRTRWFANWNRCPFRLASISHTLERFDRAFKCM